MPEPPVSPVSPVSVRPVSPVSVTGRSETTSAQVLQAEVAPSHPTMSLAKVLACEEVPSTTCRSAKLAAPVWAVRSAHGMVQSTKWSVAPVPQTSVPATAYPAAPVLVAPDSAAGAL